MNICIVNDELFSEFSGRPKATERLGLQLAARGHNIVFFSAAYNKQVKLGWQRVKLYSFPSITVPKTNGKLKIALPLVLKIKKILEKEKIDLVQINTLYLLGPAVSLIAKWKKIPVVYHVHTLAEHWTKNIKFLDNRFFQSLIYKYMIFFYNLADCTVFLTHFSKNRLKKLGFRKDSAIISNGIDLTKFNPHLNKDLFAKKFRAEDSKIILCVSRLTNEKNIAMLIDAFEDVVREHPKNKLVIIGEGYLEKALKQKVEKKGMTDKVIFTGILKQEIIASAYINSYMFILPSLVEIEPLVILESQACGCPVIASKTEYFSAEEMISNQSGFVINPYNKKDMAEKMLLLLRDKKLRERMSKKNIEIAKSKEIDKSVAKFERLYKKLLS